MSGQVSVSERWQLVCPQSQESLRAELAGSSGDYVFTAKPEASVEKLTDRRLKLLDITALQAVTEYRADDQVISLECGLTAEELDKILAANNQWWPVRADGQTTIASLMEQAEGSCLEHRFGGPRDLVLGLGVVLSTGQAIATGGRVVKNVTGYDLGKLFIGSRGWLGIVSQAHLRLFARPDCQQSYVIYATVDSAWRLASKLNSTAVPLSCCELISAPNDSASAAATALTCLLPEARQRKSDCLILIQVHAARTIIKEACQALSHSCSYGSGYFAELDSQVSEAIWRQLDNNYMSGYPVALSMPPRAMPYLLDKLRGSAHLSGWQARPSRGRLTLYGASQDSACFLSDFVLTWAGEAKQEVVLASGNADFDWQVKSVPDCARARQLKAMLKQRFDPSACLNPLVSL